MIKRYIACRGNLAASAVRGALPLQYVATSESHVEPLRKCSVLDFKMRDIDGKDVKLNKYKGKVVLIVNTASKCGYTPQYEGLQATLREVQGQGIRYVLGFPANNFGGQEPGTEAEIKEFCTSKYKVTFPMFAKISVKGEDQDPLYKFLTSPQTSPEFRRRYQVELHQVPRRPEGQSRRPILVERQARRPGSHRRHRKVSRSEIVRESPNKQGL